MKKLVIKDIATIAGVSNSTVSKVINNYGDISEETKKKVLDIIKKLNYHPSKSAQMLRKGKNDIIAFISGRIASHFTVEILAAVERMTFTTGKYVHGIVPYSTNYNKSILNEIFKKILYGREASAIIALAMNPAPTIIKKFNEERIPVVLIENFLENAHTVNVDNYKGGFMATEYLIKKGRKNIALLCGGIKERTRYGYSYAAVERKRGFEDALKKYGFKYNSKYIKFVEHYLIEEGMKLFDEFIKEKIKPDAVFCASGDMTAIGVMESAKKHGIKIPDDLAVIGYDDSMTSAYLKHPLTTIKQPIDKLGAEVLDTAIEAIEGKLKVFKHVLISPELVIRKST